MQQLFRTVLKFLLIVAGILIIVAATSLLLHDRKEKKWYNEKLTHSTLQSPDSITIVCILATVHQRNPNYNADSIVAILNQFQPDLVLSEEDSSLFEGYHQSYLHNPRKPLFARLGRSFGFGHPDENEGRAIRKYKINYPAADIRPYDYEGRNAFYEKHNTFYLEDKVNTRIEQLGANHSLDKEQLKTWTDYGHINDTLNKLNEQTPYAINQPGSYALAERRQDYQYHRVAQIIINNDSLEEYRDFYRSNAGFWDTRNKIMAQHIARFITLYPRKRIIVLCGAMHKYYLLNELMPLQDSLQFRLKEFYQQ